MASIRRRNASWQVQIRTSNKSLSASFPTLNEARRWALEQDHAAAQVGPAKHSPENFAEVLEAFQKGVLPLRPSKDVEKYLIASLMREEWARKPLGALSVSDLARFRDRQLQSLKPSSVKRKFGLARYICRVARDEWNWDVPLELFSSIRVRAPQQLIPRRVTQQEVERLLVEAGNCENEMFSAIIRLALETGMRRGELCSLQWSQVDFERSLIVLENTKSGYPRCIPMSPAARSVLETLAKKATSHSVFGVTTNAVRMAFDRLRKRAGLQHVRFHDLRHEAISRLFELGLTPPEVAMISGHRTMSMLMRYSHASIDAIGAKLQSNLGVNQG